MSLDLVLLLTLALGVALLALVLFVRRGARWGATDEECRQPMPGDDWLPADRVTRVRMTRAITIEAPREVVWAWLAQLGRGAGWHSIDVLDNGGRRSAEHLVSWIPPPRLGDATAVGYLRHLEPGRELVWWLPGAARRGARVGSVMTYRVGAADGRARVVARFTWAGRGFRGWALLRFFQVVDTMMARRQLENLKRRVELYGGRSENPADPESGVRDQYQLHQVIYASGEEAGRPGKEEAARWRGAALRDGAIADMGDEDGAAEAARRGRQCRLPDTGA